MNALPLPQINAPPGRTFAIKTLVGVDADDSYRPALDLLIRIRFANNELTFAHIDPLMADYGIGVMAPYTIVSDQMQEAVSEAAHSLLNKAAAAATAGGFGKAECIYANGNSSATLMQIAHDQKLDLVAIGSRKRGVLDRFFLGSVGRTLAIHGKQSFLVARKTEHGHGAIRAVFATDHSEYANRCFRRFLDMAPNGIDHVTIITAMEALAQPDFRLAPSYGEATFLPLSDAEDRMRAHGVEMMQMLVAQGIQAEFKFEQCHPIEDFARAMEESRSDLLILGARGHGFLERVFIGSLALHVVVAEPYSVLVLRIPDDSPL